MASEPRALGQPGAGARRDLVANPPEHLKPLLALSHSVMT
jgi:hypothetical protein